METSSFKNRNLLVLAFEILLIIISIGGLTFATSRLINTSQTTVTFGEYNVDYIGKTEITANDLEPISDSLINYNSKENVIRLEFSLRGVETNDSDNLIYDIMLSDINIDCSLLNEYTKWKLYKNNNLLSEGSLDPKFDGNILTDNMRLTEIAEDLPKHNEEYDNYVLIIWISESCEDLTTCEKVDQSNIVNSKLDTKVFIALYTGIKKEYQRIPKENYVCVNKPELYENMIPVYYDQGSWKVADKTNANIDNEWYNYTESKWANTVFVTDDKYKDSKEGTIVNNEDIIAQYVWIPRYKYKLWNAEKTINDSYNAYEKGIDIRFESGTNSTGKVKCINDVCDGKNNEYLTHPAFENNLRGFWISKYEISEGAKFIPNKESLINESLEEYQNIISNLKNTYKISENISSHIVTNLEWGATLYLSHSKYGVCQDGSCKKITPNETYVSENNKEDTTTRNVYGVYDMAGATSEYAVGKTILGSALDEVILKDNETWYDGFYNNNEKEYIIRGGMEEGLFSAGDTSMTNITTRGTLSK